MIKINQLKLPVGHSQKDLEDKIRKTLRIPSKETFHYEVMRRSLDARKKPSLFYVYCIYVTIRQENSIVKKLHQPSVSLVTEPVTVFGNGAGTFKPASGDCGSRSLWSFCSLAADTCRICAAYFRARETGRRPQCGR